VVAEGGNLGATQAGRIEFALAGGRIFTDAIDNSAGVDCSDHEVNVKIWLDTEVNAGELPEADRNRILNEMTGDIERLVLRDNTLQTHLLVREAQAQSNLGVVDGYAALIASLEAEGAVSRELEQLPGDAELQRRKALGLGLTTPELAVVVANVKNRFKRTLSALPLTELPWAATVLRPYFPGQLVATRDPLAHPLANAILATVLANEAINRCGPLMVRDLAIEHRIDETEVIKAWGRAWSALHLAPVFDALDADALKVPRDVSVLVDARTRAMLRTVIEGVLALPAGEQGAGGMEVLSTLFAQPDQLRQLMPTRSEADSHHAGLAQAFVQAWRAVDTIESLATFLFTAVSVQRPASMSLAQFLEVGMALREQAGIDTLERGLRLAPASKSQEQLRNYARQALRRTQQRLLLQVLARAGEKGDALAAVRAVTADMGLAGYAEATDLEQAMLDVWALSEGASPDRLAA
jgi:glutamate dehydrogenase